MKKRLISLMKQYNLSRDALAEYTKISKSEIIAWLTTTKMPDYFSLIKLADFFEVTLDYLCERANGNNSLNQEAENITIEKLIKKTSELENSLMATKRALSAMKAESKYTEEERLLFSKFRELSDFKKEQVTGFIYTLEQDNTMDLNPDENK